MIEYQKIKPPFPPYPLRYRVMEFTIERMIFNGLTAEEIDKKMEEDFGDYYVECRERAKEK